ncbi:hypothetical protein E8L99_22035 [Phreatobacter aquaticus]|uniref:Uncharacterized protein n=1 Tax=Phreatobacter aquaticus TaxID=2570229 RepID=A0A4D7QT38_9HYPH|nr:hypothetical protein [Phreatobacter aquaticus]QCK88247.1 hypothetical protein E8L99_22035 [Phreatobacter aquaticus]
MADDFALAYRKNRTSGTAARSSGVSLPWPILALVGLVLGALGAAAAGFSPLGLFSLGQPASRGAAVATSAAEGPRVISMVPGVKVTATGSAFGPNLMSNQQLRQVYLPVGPVLLRFESSFIEIDGPKLYPPPLGTQRQERRILDHAMVLGNMLRPLGYTPCDLHLRYVAAANINLFIGGFMAQRTPIQTDAAPNTTFWQRPETSSVRRVVQELAERGAIGLADFGRDTSPEVKGLFQGIRQVQPACG